MKTFTLYVEWLDTRIDTFVNVKDYRVMEGALHIWFSTGHPGAKIIPNRAYIMAWPEEADDCS